MKIYDIALNNDEELGLLSISLVDEPAVEVDFLKFDKQAFQFTNEEQHIISGIAILANTPIYRWSPEFGEYYIRFTPSVIKELVEKYSKENRLNIINFQHEDNYTDEDATMIESLFINHERGICPKEFDSAPDGSWYVSFKINNDNLWEEIKTSGKLNGFSVEVISYLEDASFGTLKPTVEDFNSWVDGLLKSDFKVVTRGDIREAMKTQKMVDLSYYDTTKRLIDAPIKTVKCQISDLIKNGESYSVSVFNPTTDKWMQVRLKDITNIKVLDTPIQPWNYNKGYYDIVNNPDNVFITSHTADRQTIEKCIDNHKWVMITYDDESETAATNERQCVIAAYGVTTKGNECIRIYEQYGDTSTDIEGLNGWKLLLTRRIRSFKVMNELPPFNKYPEGFHTGDSNMTVLYDELTGLD